MKYQASKFNRDEVLGYIKDNFDRLAEVLKDGSGSGVVLTEGVRGLFRDRDGTAIHTAAIDGNKAYPGISIDDCSDGVLEVIKRDIELLEGSEGAISENPFIQGKIEDLEDVKGDNPFLPIMDDKE